MPGLKTTAFAMILKPLISQIATDPWSFCHRMSDTAVIGVVERVGIDRGQIFLDRGIEPVEDIVHARGFRDALTLSQPWPVRP